MKARLNLLCLGLLISCQEQKLAETAAWDLSKAPLSEEWKEAAMMHSGGFMCEAEGMTMKAGQPMTGIVFPSWVEKNMPLMDYSISYQAMRVKGSDFFGSVTFPVSNAERCVTFVLGGWGGSQVGISSIDGYDASENTTGSSQPFENGQWYRVRIEVREASLQVWINDRPIINTNILGRQLGLRGGEIRNCMPFGFATYGTEGKVREVEIRRLKTEG